MQRSRKMLFIKKSQSVGDNLGMTQVIELVENDVKIVIINVIYGQEDCVKWIMEIIIFCGILST